MNVGAQQAWVGGIGAFCNFAWFVSIDALHTTWQSVLCAAHVWTILDYQASDYKGYHDVPLFSMRLILLWWLQMPWCETGTKLKRNSPYLDDITPYIPISRLAISGHCIDFVKLIMLNDMYILLQIFKWNWYRYAGVSRFVVLVSCGSMKYIYIYYIYIILFGTHLVNIWYIPMTSQYLYGMSNHRHRKCLLNKIFCQT